MLTAKDIQCLENPEPLTPPRRMHREMEMKIWDHKTLFFGNGKFWDHCKTFGKGNGFWMGRDPQYVCVVGAFGGLWMGPGYSLFGESCTSNFLPANAPSEIDQRRRPILCLQLTAAATKTTTTASYALTGTIDKFGGLGEMEMKIWDHTKLFFGKGKDIHCLENRVPLTLPRGMHPEMEMKIWDHETLFSDRERLGSTANGLERERVCGWGEIRSLFVLLESLEDIHCLENRAPLTPRRRMHLEMEMKIWDH
nr:hypothetical protein Iba_chr08cCG9130 [Ipomoea batatas]GMD27187.1 hypothetical protein Iba_chr08dCG11350 [Ipomoea batatas]